MAFNVAQKLIAFHLVVGEMIPGSESGGARPRKEYRLTAAGTDGWPSCMRSPCGRRGTRSRRAENRCALSAQPAGPTPSPAPGTTRNPRKTSSCSPVLAHCERPAAEVGPRRAVRAWYLRRNATPHSGKFARSKRGNASPAAFAYTVLTLDAEYVVKDAWLDAMARTVQLVLPRRPRLRPSRQGTP
jgi:hypothetical protein